MITDSLHVAQELPEEDARSFLLHVVHLHQDALVNFVLLHVHINLVVLFVGGLVLGLLVHYLGVGKGALCEFDEEVSHDGVVEEAVLGLLRILVHSLPYQLEVNLGSLHHPLDVSLLVVVAQNDREHAARQLQ